NQQNVTHLLVSNNLKKKDVTARYALTTVDDVPQLSADGGSDTNVGGGGSTFCQKTVTPEPLSSNRCQWSSCRRGDDALGTEKMIGSNWNVMRHSSDDGDRKNKVVVQQPEGGGPVGRSSYNDSDERSEANKRQRWSSSSSSSMPSSRSLADANYG
ncbi:unnamed protein product, partial [Soboliphyme baturini]|uniref:Neuron navigator 2 n=1 Tax=Soboliphyme baturini TaxID=241478 RepID=A0A183IPT4_9BILA